ncbi:hypothetical protein BST61_g7079 [Cercospora zeina]
MAQTKLSWVARGRAMVLDKYPNPASTTVQYLTNDNERDATVGALIESQCLLELERVTTYFAVVMMVSMELGAELRRKKERVVEGSTSSLLTRAVELLPRPTYQQVACL